MINLVTQLTNLGERQGKTTLKAAKILTSVLDASGVPYAIEKISTFIPRGTSTLHVDGKRIDSAPTSMKSGVITSKNVLVSSRIGSGDLSKTPNINFNPESRALSLSDFYFAPAIAIRAQDVAKVIDGEKVRGVVKIKKTKFVLPQILVGNQKNPEVVVFSHYDSIGPGAIDNASGTVVCLTLATEHPEFLKDVLYVFDPNEENSYDYPTYWGHGYRVFEARHQTLLKKAKRIIVVDSVGNGNPEAIRDPEIINLAFPLANLAVLPGDVVTIAGDIPGMMKVYQSEADLPQLLKETHMRATADLVAQMIAKSI